MKKFLKKLGIGLATLLVLLLVIGFLMPTSYEIKRSIEVEAPMETVFAQVNDLHNWEHWSPWMKVDPLMEIAYSNPHVGHRAYYNWKSDHKYVRNGKLVLAEVVPNTRIVTAMHFEEWDDGTAQFDFTQNGKEVKVSWSMELTIGKDPVSRLFGVMQKNGMKKMFDQGLEGIKEASER